MENFCPERRIRINDEAEGLGREEVVQESGRKDREIGREIVTSNDPFFIRATRLNKFPPQRSIDTLYFLRVPISGRARFLMNIISHEDIFEPAPPTL